ncbi:N-acetylneuraminate synthase [Methanococcoides sp. SA1]|nr:N-acetylneuraminate synthase [Methanococcoides sp. SA1]
MNMMMIGTRWIGEQEPAYIIGEIGINHNGDIDLAKRMVDSLVECGVDAVKFQIFKAKDFISDPSETYEYSSNGVIIREPMIDMFQRYELSTDDWEDIVNYCSSKSVDFFVTPQNPSDLDYLLSIVDVPAIKVGSDDLTNLDLLDYYARKNKPLIISAGMAYISEIEDAVNTIQDTGNGNLVILHCISSYPAEPEEINLTKILTIRQAFDCIVGYSDHTIGYTSAVGAVLLGAKVIEKHFTMDKQLSGPDHWFSADFDEMKQLVDEIKYIEKASGTGVIKPTIKELEMRNKARRSVVASQNIPKDAIITKNNLEFKRPGNGLPPKFEKYVIGKKAKVDIDKNEQILFETIY